MHVVRLVSQPTEFDISCKVSSFSLTFDKIVHRKQILIRKQKEVGNSWPHDLMRTQVTRDHLFSPFTWAPPTAVNGGEHPGVFSFTASLEPCVKSCFPQDKSVLASRCPCHPWSNEHAFHSRPKCIFWFSAYVACRLSAPCLRHGGMRQSRTLVRRVRWATCWTYCACQNITRKKIVERRQTAIHY